MFDHAVDAREGQGRALWLSTIAFTVCFAVWTIFAIIGIRIKDELGLNETQFGLLVAVGGGNDVRAFARRADAVRQGSLSEQWAR